MESNTFTAYCKEAVQSYPETLNKWINSTDPVKRALGALVIEKGGSI